MTDQQKRLEEAAEEYAGRDRCAKVTSSDKEWHRLKASFKAGAAYERARAEVLVEALDGLFSQMYDLQLEKLVFVNVMSLAKEALNTWRGK